MASSVEHSVAQVWIVVSSEATVRFPVVPSEIRRAGLGVAEEALDEALMARVTGGDQQALGCLFQRYGRLLHSIASRILKDAAEAEDLVQDLFLFIHRKCGMFDSSKSSARSWIVQMAYHRAIERRRYLVTRQFYTHAEVESMGHQDCASTFLRDIRSRR